MAVCCKLLQIAVLCIVKVTWKFSKQKQAHVGMESNQIRYDITFMPTLLLVLFCQLRTPQISISTCTLFIPNE